MPGLTAPDGAWVTEIGYPEPDRGPLQVLRSRKPEPQAGEVAA